MYINLLRVTLILSTIPIQTKISISKVPTKVSSFFTKNKEEIIHQEFNSIKNIFKAKKLESKLISVSKSSCNFLLKKIKYITMFFY